MNPLNRLVTRIEDDIRCDRLKLPTLPDVALKVRDLAADDRATAAKVGAAIAMDPSTAARLLRVANSAGSAPGRVVSDLPAAVARLGMDVTRHLVMALAMEQMYDSRKPAIAGLMRASRARSIELAALARWLARRAAWLNAELALIAGLTAEIGLLPLLRLCEAESVEMAPNDLERTLDPLHPKVGTLILRAWGMPPEIQQVPVWSRDLRRDHDGPADYADTVTAAMILSRRGSGHWIALIDAATVPACDRLGVARKDEVEAAANDAVCALSGAFG